MSVSVVAVGVLLGNIVEHQALVAGGILGGLEDETGE